MIISFSGVLAPYTYNCPRAHRFRNVQKIKLEPRTPEEESTGTSKRELGIQHHELLGKYLKGEVDDFPFITDTVAYYRSNPAIVVEEPFIFDETLVPLSSKPTEGHYVYMRPDLFLYNEGILRIVDWKFGNSEYGTTRYYDEVTFFAVCLASKLPDLERVDLEVHFPTENYSLPLRSYNFTQLAMMQQVYIKRIEKILGDKFCAAKPAQIRCRICDFRDYCEYSVCAS